MAVNPNQIYAALAKIRSARTEEEAKAARNEAKNLGLFAMRELKSREEQRQFSVSLDEDIRNAWNSRKTTG